MEDTDTYQVDDWNTARSTALLSAIPSDKQDITGIIYEPWHFRYVGVEAATYMMENNLCLEEFIALYNKA